MTSKCLICNAEVPSANGINAPLGKGPKKSRSSDPVEIPLLCDKGKFALTQIQYTVLQKVLTLPDGACKNELILGPYCRECFTNINNVCHCMSALENLQQSVIEFRKDFSDKMLKSCAGQEAPVKSQRKRKCNSTGEFVAEPAYSARSTILNYLNKSVFSGEVPKVFSKHIHEIISNMDPNTQSPDTHVEAEMVVRTTNGNMPTPRRNGTVKGKINKSSKKNTSSNSKPRSKLKKSKPPSKSKAVISSGDVIEAAEDYKCWCCSKVFSTDDELKAHELTAHRLKCTSPGCTKVFHMKKSLQSHMLKVHKLQTFDKRRVYQCDQCPKSYSKKKTLATHKGRVHRTATKTLNKPLVAKNTNKTGRPGRCKICTKIVMNVTAHMKSTHPESLIESRVSKTAVPSTSISPPIKKARETITSRGGRVSSNYVDDDGYDEFGFKPKYPLPPPPQAAMEPKSEETKTDSTTNKKEATTEGVPSSTSTETSSMETKVNPSKQDWLTRPSPSFSIFQIPPFSSSSPSPQIQTTSSKYQFKNLLKIKDKP